MLEVVTIAIGCNKIIDWMFTIVYNEETIYLKETMLVC